MKKETLEEAFLNTLIDKELKTKEDYIAFKGAQFGANWQAERMYSEVIEVAERLASTTDEFNMFIAGANWQAERMYSEEDLKRAWEDGRDGTSLVGSFPFTKTRFTHCSFKQWFEQFKKK